MNAYDGCKNYGLSEDKIPEGVKFAFLRQDDQNKKFISAYSQGRSYINSIQQANNNINKTITTFTEKPGNEIFKPYFTGDKFENEQVIDKEIAFLETALMVLRDMRKIKCDSTKKFLKDTVKCVEILDVIINDLPALHATE
jgi:hypothetical protein